MVKSLFLLSQEDWSLHRKGQVDQQRHQDKVKKAIKENLADIISEESIITNDGKKIVKLPIRSLEEYRFRFNYEKQQHNGQGKGNSKKGDVIGQDESKKENGSEEKPGEEPGVDYYEAEVTIDELAELIFADLGLPNLEDKQKEQIESESYRFTDVRKHGIMSNVDKKRTIMENIRSNALKGIKGTGAIQPDDLRYKTWETHHEPDSNAVIFAMMDTSGSMDTNKKYIARSFYFWMVRFLRTKYRNVEIVFLAHHSTAKEVNEEEFFTKGESGGTKCSTVYKLALEIIEERFQPNRYNIYPFHFSDGDNFSSDNGLCLELIQQLLEFSNMFGYGEIEDQYYNSRTLMEVYKGIDHNRFVAVKIPDKSMVYPALQKFFYKGEDKAW